MTKRTVVLNREDYNCLATLAVAGLDSMESAAKNITVPHLARVAYKEIARLRQGLQRFQLYLAETESR